MSGELKPELSLAVGDEIEVYSMGRRDGPGWIETVEKIARVWITTTKGRRFRLDRQNEGLEFGWGGYHFRTAAQRDYADRVDAAWSVLKENGLTKASYGEEKRLHDAKLFAVADLLKSDG